MHIGENRKKKKKGHKNSYSNSVKYTREKLSVCVCATGPHSLFHALPNKARALYFQKLEQVPPDELKGRRIHSWVLINIQSDEFKFIEPTTGVIHDLAEESPYLKIESLWDHTNYWLNMNPSTPPHVSIRLRHLYRRFRSAIVSTIHE